MDFTLTAHTGPNLFDQACLESTLPPVNKTRSHPPLPSSVTPAKRTESKPPTLMSSRPFITHHRLVSRLNKPDQETEAD
ncbi:hypothetical protein LXL04_027645 [Taraxacum kok-saghyz]